MTWANQVVDTVKQGFSNNFNVNFTRQRTRATASLNQRPGCEWPHINDICRLSCGPSGSATSCALYHHRSGRHFITVYTGTGATRVLRFVNFRLCFVSLNDEVRGAVLGLANRHGGDAIMTTQTHNIHGVTAHEISHLLGARDGVCSPNQLCVMSNTFATHNQWCTICRNDIMRLRGTSATTSNLSVDIQDKDFFVSEMADYLAFSSLNEFITSYNAMIAGRTDNDFARLADNVNLLDLHRMYKPVNIPDEFHLHKLVVYEQMVIFWYFHKDDLVSEDTILDAIAQQQHFLFNFTRWDIESPMDGIILQNNATASDLINGQYLFIEPNLFIWSSSKEVIFMYTPLRLHAYQGLSAMSGDITKFLEPGNVDKLVQYTEVEVINLQGANED